MLTQSCKESAVVLAGVKTVDANGYRKVVGT